MISREQAANIAQLVRTIRPAWDELAIVNVLGELKGHDVAEVTAAAMNAARDNTITTPKGILFPGPHWPSTAGISDAMFREPKCYICGHYRSRCRARRDWEIERGLPDPHEFETLEDADRHTSRRTA